MVVSEMVVSKTIIKTELGKILPTFYELFVDSDTVLPAITYIETSNIDDKVGDTLGYSRITYRIKLWASTVADFDTYSPQIDTAMRGLGFWRINAYETVRGVELCRTMEYRALANEFYK